MHGGQLEAERLRDRAGGFLQGQEQLRARAQHDVVERRPPFRLVDEDQPQPYPIGELGCAVQEVLGAFREAHRTGFLQGPGVACDHPAVILRPAFEPVGGERRRRGGDAGPNRKPLGQRAGEGARVDALRRVAHLATAVYRNGEREHHHLLGAHLWRV